MWIADFADGSESVSEERMYWTDLPTDRKLSSLQLKHPYLPKLFVRLSHYDRYYFVKEGVASFGHQGTVVAEAIGAHDLKLGVGVEVRLEYSGNLRVLTYPVKHFKNDSSILRNGRVNGAKPTCEVTEDGVSKI